MKYLFLFFTLVIFSGCSHKNAFSNFDMDLDQQLSEQSFKKIKLYKNDKIIGTFSSIYLNEIYPNRYNKNEYFFVYIYLKNTQDIEKYKIQLNGNNFLKIKKLNANNKFSRLINERNKWSTYYLVSFKEVGKTINLTLSDNQSILASIKYKKNEH